jgi:hypothetical protein
MRKLIRDRTEHDPLSARSPIVKLAVAYLAWMACAACAHHAMPRADPRCSDGEVLYHSDDHASREIRIWISTTGAWVYNESGSAEKRGCLDASDLADVNAAISSATWMPLGLEGDSFCAPGSPTEYYVHDQLVFTTDSCDSLLDRETSNAVVEIESTVRDGIR